MSSIEPLTAVGGSDVPPPAPVENPGALLDRDAFLKLLVAQLKHQDPSQPADASQMLAQSAQLTMVDQLGQISESLTDAAALDQLTLAGTMIGREVSFRTDTGELRTELVQAVRLETGDLMLHAGGYLVPIEAVSQISDPPPPLVPPSDERTAGLTF